MCNRGHGPTCLCDDSGPTSESEVRSWFAFNGWDYDAEYPTIPTGVPMEPVSTASTLPALLETALTIAQATYSLVFFVSLGADKTGKKRCLFSQKTCTRDEMFLVLRTVANRGRYDEVQKVSTWGEIALSVGGVVFITPPVHPPILDEPATDKEYLSDAEIGRDYMTKALGVAWSVTNILPRIEAVLPTPAAVTGEDYVAEVREGLRKP